MWRDGEAAPTASFKMAQAEFLLQFLVIPFDDPAALFGQSNQVAQADVFGQIRQPVFARFGLAAGPFDEQPFFRSDRSQ